MARTVRDTKLETKAARLRLAPRRKPYWRALEGGFHLGYRRTKAGGGTWTARRFIGEGRYSEASLGVADDLQDADGVALLDFRQAQAKAREVWKAAERAELGVAPHAGPYTVARACDDYLEHFRAKGAKSEYATQRTIEVHIRPTLGDRDANKLTMQQVRAWHRKLAVAPKLVRTKLTAAKRATKAIDVKNADASRSRRATANRILTVLKAVLNHAWRERHISSDEAWRTVKPFPKVDSAVVRYLTDDECRRLVNTCATDLRVLVRGALLTGARYGELARLRVADVDLENGTVAIREAKGGKPRHVVLTDEGRELFAELTAGRQGVEIVFTHDDETGWKASQQTRPLREACVRVSIAPAIGFHVLRHTHASRLAMAGVPLGVIAAQLGHADTRITEKHYAHLAPNYVADTIRANFSRLNLADAKSNVVAMAGGK